MEHEVGLVALNAEKDLLQGINELLSAKPLEQAGPSSAQWLCAPLRSGVGPLLLGLLLKGPSASALQERLVSRGLCEAFGGGAYEPHELLEPRDLCEPHERLEPCDLHEPHEPYE